MPHDKYQVTVNVQDYDIGGEEYLTFAGTRSNLGGGMDAKSGVFTVPQVCILLCSSDSNGWWGPRSQATILQLHFKPSADCDNVQAGAYMFTIHICTHDMKKGLLSLR